MKVYIFIVFVLMESVEFVWIFGYFVFCESYCDIVDFYDFDVCNNILCWDFVLF